MQTTKAPIILRIRANITGSLKTDYLITTHAAFHNSMVYSSEKIITDRMLHVFVVNIQQDMYRNAVVHILGSYSLYHVKTTHLISYNTHGQLSRHIFHP